MPFVLCAPIVLIVLFVSFVFRFAPSVPPVSIFVPYVPFVSFVPLVQPPVHVHKKMILEQTRRTATIPRPPLESSRQDGFGLTNRTDQCPCDGFVT